LTDVSVVNKILGIFLAPQVRFYKLPHFIGDSTEG